MPGSEPGSMTFFQPSQDWGNPHSICPPRRIPELGIQQAGRSPDGDQDTTSNPLGFPRRACLRHRWVVPGIIAIVGRPNVGKSALFNRVAGRRIAIVHDQPGVTRDRVTAEVEWHGRPFTLADTGGIGLSSRQRAPDVLTEAALAQAAIAIEAASV